MILDRAGCIQGGNENTAGSDFQISASLCCYDMRRKNIMI